MISDIHSLTSSLERAIEAGEETEAPRLAQTLLDLGLPPSHITAALARAMSRLGEQFQRLDIFVPDLLIAADAFEAVMQVVTPMILAEGPSCDKGAVIIGVVEGDIHSLGKDLVRVMLAADGFRVHDLGRDVRPDAFLAAAREQDSALIALSALMTTTMGAMKEVIDLLISQGLRDRHKVIVGGAPITQQFADSIGADGYAEDAPRAVALANRLLAASPRTEPL